LYSPREPGREVGERERGERERGEVGLGVGRGS